MQDVWTVNSIDEIWHDVLFVSGCFTSPLAVGIHALDLRNWSYPTGMWQDRFHTDDWLEAKKTLWHPTEFYDAGRVVVQVIFVHSSLITVFINSLNLNNKCSEKIEVSKTTTTSSQESFGECGLWWLTRWVDDGLVVTLKGWLDTPPVPTWTWTEGSNGCCFRKKKPSYPGWWIGQGFVKGKPFG